MWLFTPEIQGETAVKFGRQLAREYGLPKKLEVAARSYMLRDWFNQWESGPTQERIEPVEVDLRILTEFTPRENGLDIDVSASGQKGIPLQLEFGIRKQGKLILGGREYDLNAIDLIPMEDEDAVIKSGDDRLIIRGGVVQHKIYSSHNGQMASSGTTRLMLTPVTPFSGRIQMIYA